jgi:cytoskeletal protein CcmA (bactofilin family)
MALFGRRQPGDTPAKPGEGELRDSLQPRPLPRPEALTPVARPAGAAPIPVSQAAPQPHAAVAPAAPVAADPTRRPPVDGITAPSGPAAMAGALRRNEERPMPVQAPAAPMSSPAASDQDGKKLIVGKQIVLSGEIKACEKLIVEGRVEAALTDCHSISILPDGLFKGSASIDIADISGHFDGDLIVRQRLILRSTGHIAGNVRYGQVEIERGGIIAGDMRPISEGEKLPERKPGTGGADGGARGG